jgi:two-component system, OmpR family, copper resistance phosphate regulon response regulator CusR
MRILIAEDDTALAGFVRKGLEAEHYAVDVSSDGEQARALGTEFDYDLIVLDLTLPRLDGVTILKQVRSRKPSVPVLVLTARSRVEDRVLCLNAGADDYLVKPFSFSELSARIRALLRRNRVPPESVLTVEDLKLDRVERRVTRGNRAIELTSKEFALLEYLMRNAGRRVTRAMIIEHVWNLSFDSATNLVDVYVAYLPNAPEDTPFFLCLRSEMKQLLTRVISELPEKERQVLALYYYEELTMKEVGSAMGIGESRVSQIHTIAVIRLRARLQELMATHNQRAQGAGAGSAS